MKGNSTLRGDSIEHESFGAIEAAHVSGNAQLFMSPHKHMHFVTVRITRASVSRDLNEDRHFSDRSIIAEVAMSEAQWAHFVSSPNQGNGAPCTITYYRDGDLKRAEKPPEHAGNRETFSTELRERAATILKGVRDAINSLDIIISRKPAVSKIELREVRRALSIALANDLDGGMGFTLKQAESWLDKMVESAKTEVEAGHLAGLRGLAMSAIRNEMSPEARAEIIRQVEQAIALPSADVNRDLENES